MLGIERVTVRYGASVAVSAVTESAAKGEWVGLIGANGAGKSSLLRAAAQLVPYDGAVKVAGETMGRISPRRRARLVAYVPQQPELPAGMSAIDYTLLGRTPHIGYFGVESAEDQRVCAEVLDRIGLAGLAERHLSTLSGGELQRVVLARALVGSSRSSTGASCASALDLGRRVDALELVDELRRERGLTVLSAMHDLTLAAQFADRLVLMSGGQVVAAGVPADVLDEQLLSACFGARVRVLTDDEGQLLVVPQRTRRRIEC